MKANRPKYRYHRTFNYYVFFILSIGGCTKFVQDPPSKNTIITASVFADSADATAGVIGMYYTIMTTISPTFLNGANTVYNGLAADELVPTNNTGDVSQFYENAISPTLNGTLYGSLWGGAYPLIYQANACLEGLTSGSGNISAYKSQLIGESKLTRALCYFHLVNLFGPVPLVTTTNFNINSDLPKSPIDSVYSQIVADLLSAEGLLSSNYPSAGKVRPNLYACKALLSRVYLFLGEWDKAESEASDIINSGMYNLEPDLNNVFLAGSTEAIWQLQPTIPGFETTEGYVFVPYSSSSTPTYLISNYLLNAFEAGDQRILSWMGTYSANGQSYYYPFKYKLSYDRNSAPIEDYMIFRLGELYLIRSEARAQLGNDSGSIADLNIIRNRAGLANSAAASQTDLLTAIAHERQTELFCELGSRWYDLKRTGQANTVMMVVTPTKGGTWNSDWQLFPIPYSQIQFDPFLKQNPGYN